MARTAKKTRRNNPTGHVSLEDIASQQQEIRARGLDSTTFEGYIEVQRLFIRGEIRRWESIQCFPLVLLDLGPEEIEFYTVYYPRAKGLDWPVEEVLRAELAALRECSVTSILLLDNSLEGLRSNRAADASRKRGFFEFSSEYLLPLKREWLTARGDTTFLNTHGLSPEKVGQQVLEWVNSFKV